MEESKLKLDFFSHYHYKCTKCTSIVFYSLGEVMSEFDVDYVDCPFCGQSHAIDIGEFIIKDTEKLF